MPDNTDDKNIQDNPIYQAILEKLNAQDAKIAELDKKTAEVTDFNKALLSRKGPDGATDTKVDDAIKKLEQYINEN